MPTGDIMRATIEGTFGGEPVVVGLGFVSASGAADFNEDAGTLADELITLLELNGAGVGVYLSPLSAQYKLSGVRVQDISPGVSAGYFRSVGGIGGNVVDDAMPPNDALCVTWRTSLKGVQNRGRTYLTGFAEDSNNAGYWIPEIQDWADGSFAQLLMGSFGPLGGGNYAFSVIHRVAGGTPLVPPTATPITSFTVHNEVRSLRRRAVGVRISRRPTGP